MLLGLGGLGYVGEGAGRGHCFTGIWPNCAVKLWNFSFL